MACLDGDISTGRCEEWEYFDSELKHCVEKDQFDCQIVPGPECPDSFGISFIPSSESCEEYYLCVNGDPHTMNCRAGLHWNQDKVACDYPQSANCLVTFFC